MIRQILSILTGDAELMRLIDRIEPVETDYMGSCALYDYVPVADDKITQQSRLQITIIADTIARAMEADRRVRTLLLTYADRALTKDILQVEVSGGASLYDYERKKHHRSTYYTIQARSDSNGN